MSSRPSALLASAALTVGLALVPAGAYADTAPGEATTTDPAPAFTTAALAAALTAAEAPSAAAGKAGWIARGTITERGSVTEALKAVYAVDRGLLDAGPVGTILEAQRAGMYLTINTLGPGMRAQQALKAVNKPHATWVFMRNPRLDLRDAASDSAVASVAPDQVLVQLVDPAQSTLTGTPTRTVSADGSTTYAFTEHDVLSGGADNAITLTIDSAGVLTAFASVTAAETDAATYSYGPQQVTLPSPARTISLRLFTEGHFLATLPRQIKQAATQLARTLTWHAHGHAVTASALRTAAKRFASSLNRTLGEKVITVEPTVDGVRITGTNHYRHQHVSYTVTVHGTKAVAHRA